MTNIEKAAEMIKYQDWYYEFVESGYAEARARAYASMRAYVKFMNSCPQEEATILRQMWMDAYNHAVKTMATYF